MTTKMIDVEDGKWKTVAEASEVLGISDRTIRRIISVAGGGIRTETRPVEVEVKLVRKVPKLFVSLEDLEHFRKNSNTSKYIPKKYRP